MATPQLKREIDYAIKGVEVAVGEAAELRKARRRKSKPGGRRQPELIEQLDRLREASARVRHLSGMVPWSRYRISKADEERLKAATEQCAAERRRLRKMLR